MLTEDDFPPEWTSEEADGTTCLERDTDPEAVASRSFINNANGAQILHAVADFGSEGAAKRTFDNAEAQLASCTANSYGGPLTRIDLDLPASVVVFSVAGGTPPGGERIFLRSVYLLCDSRVATVDALGLTDQEFLHVVNAASTKLNDEC